MLKGIIFLFQFIFIISAAEFYWDPNGNLDIIGALKVEKLTKEQTLIEIANKYNIGLYEMIEANPNLDSKGLIPKNVDVLIPSMFILPNCDRSGIVINLAEMRLFYFDKLNNKVYTYPVGIGRTNWETPIWRRKIVKKEKDPYWRPSENMKKATKEEFGEDLPNEIPPGKNNPLGRFSLRMGWTEYLIHDGDLWGGIGMRSTGGCIRMNSSDIEELYGMVDVGIIVEIIHQPIKVGTSGNNIFIESHEPLQEKSDNIQEDIISSINKIQETLKDANGLVYWSKIKKLVKEKRGAPLLAGRRKPFKSYSL